MRSLANVAIHASQFPDSVRRDLLESLRTGAVNHKFHYDSVKQTQKWLALHQEYAPSRTNEDCAAIYDRSFEAVAKRIEAKRVHLIGLGCGGGQKDTRLLRLLQKGGREVLYAPSDVSTAMVLVARGAAIEVVSEGNCYPLVCDLVTAEDLPQVLEKLSAPQAHRIITFFGMIPNFEPDVILPRIAGLLRSEDLLLFSANLAPGPDYGAGIGKILPQYDNAQTRDWLMTFLVDLGVEANDGKLDFKIEDVPMAVEDEPSSSGNPSATSGAVGTPRPTLARKVAHGDSDVLVKHGAKVGRGVPTAPRQALKRVAAYFQFDRERELSIEDQQFQFGPNKPIRLFFSYRHTPKLIESLLGRHGINVIDEWIAKSEEEGVFLCKRK